MALGLRSRPPRGPFAVGIYDLWQMHSVLRNIRDWSHPLAGRGLPPRATQYSSQRTTNSCRATHQRRGYARAKTKSGSALAR